MIIYNDRGTFDCGGKKYRGSIMVRTGHICSRWHSRRSHAITRNDIQPLFRKKPEVLVIGTGSTGNIDVKPSVFALCDNQRIKFIVQHTPHAVRTYNTYTRKGYETIGVFHGSC
ncbi:MAG: hypothetical protein GF384_03920 [Elusimicrobia bacterium]|nr:hypothetical protein [Elusimicrobiota bacterium]MBD3412041.1 hypothetical protein [Elusimicrobiota bacterium]